MPTKRASPRPGRDQANDTSGAYLSALAVEVLDQEQMKIVRERRKVHRATAEGKGVVLGHLDWLYKMRDEEEGEIEKYFRGMWSAATSLFSGLATQMDMFVVKSPRERLAAFRHKGLMAGLKGDEAEPPKNFAGDQLQAWQDGFNEGAAARADAEVTLADTLADALKTAAGGGVVDGTGGKRATKPGAKAAKAVAAVRAQAAADFTEDQRAEAARTGIITDDDPLGVKLPGEADGSGFEQDMGAAIEEQKALSDTHTGAPSTDPANVVDLKGEPFEAAKEELDKQIARPKDGEDPNDPLVVDGVRHPNKTRANEARKLSQSAKAAKARAEAGV